jgi:hypothetical protein
VKECLDGKLSEQILEDEVIKQDIHGRFYLQSGNSFKNFFFSF